MGIDVEIAPRSRDNPIQLQDRRGVFADFVCTAQLSDTVCLRFIDPYGDTIFNYLQLPVLLEELELHGRLATDAELRAHIRSMIELVKRANAGGPDMFVKFVGD